MRFLAGNLYGDDRHDSLLCGFGSCFVAGPICRLPASGVLTAVDMEDLARDESRMFEVEDGIHDVANFAHPADRVQAGERRMGLSRMHRGLDYPGETALTRTPLLENSIASDRVTAFRPPLVSDASAEGMPTIG